MKKIISILIPMFVVTAAPQLTLPGAHISRTALPNACVPHGTEYHHAMVKAMATMRWVPPYKTTHHFRLTASGGAIDVTANDPKDSSNIDAIRMHLAHIAKAFGEGDYSAPMLVHDTIPPGVTTMQLLKDKIHFEYTVVDSGGRVSIATDDAVARAAIHDFLRFQITDHETADPLDPNAGK